MGRDLAHLRPRQEHAGLRSRAQRRRHARVRDPERPGHVSVVPLSSLLSVGPSVPRREALRHRERSVRLRVAGPAAHRRGPTETVPSRSTAQRGGPRRKLQRHLLRRRGRWLRRHQRRRRLQHGHLLSVRRPGARRACQGPRLGALELQRAPRLLARGFLRHVPRSAQHEARGRTARLCVQPGPPRASACARRAPSPAASPGARASDDASPPQRGRRGRYVRRPRRELPAAPRWLGPRAARCFRSAQRPRRGQVRYDGVLPEAHGGLSERRRATLVGLFSSGPVRRLQHDSVGRLRAEDVVG